MFSVHANRNLKRQQSPGAEIFSRCSPFILHTNSSNGTEFSEIKAVFGGQVLRVSIGK